MTRESQFAIEWVDRGREPTQPSNPGFPEGIDLDVVGGKGDRASCTAELPYPAPRCGLYVVKCRRCDMTVGCTTAGRPDDPRSITFPCKVSQ